MRFAGKVLALHLAAIWLPTSAHCQLESFTGLELLACNDSHKDAFHSGEACEGDGCALVEIGLYKLERSSATLSAPHPVE